MKAMASASTPPTGRWLHSFEEDEPGVEVYRPAEGFAFPPARRGRESLEFGATGALSMGAPGPDDRPRETAGQWTAIGMNRYRLADAGETGRVIEIVERTPDMIKIRRP